MVIGQAWKPLPNGQVIPLVLSRIVQIVQLPQLLHFTMMHSILRLFKRWLMQGNLQLGAHVRHGVGEYSQWMGRHSPWQNGQAYMGIHGMTESLGIPSMHRYAFSRLCIYIEQLFS
jgi:hypothetical protein